LHNDEKCIIVKCGATNRLKIHFLGGKNMPSLQVRELPVNIYQRLQRRAKAEHRSLAQEAVVTLARGMETTVSHKNRRRKLLKAIAEQTCFFDEKTTSVDPVQLIREDRER
jgi:plasmid stability protein